ncbi:hypothetical protein N7474_005061 [Penicillium riverlandense]|uniref:uncharacterized protein n=1 Tax=Penicillium riverlandense TaxID=1903569 RepID=UPI0025495197|nr:uncharacterized protein N7474_005061 [Penicillium riverlandense]KAJ5819470.1 hypothetical protein N7474_005061 [Penicillium riverlandense]
MEAATHSPGVDERKDIPKAMNGLDQSLHEMHGTEEALTSELISAGSEHLQRQLGGKEIQLLAVGGAIGTFRYFGTAEFYLAIFKVFLMMGLICYTFVTMVGGNPEHWAYGFTYWKNPGAFVEYLAPGNTGRFLGFVSCVIQGSFTMVGPEFISMTAGEAENPRKLMHRAFSSFVWRLLLFFLGGALCVGIVIPYNDVLLLKYINGTEGGTGAA